MKGIKIKIKMYGFDICIVDVVLTGPQRIGGSVFYF